MAGRFPNGDRHSSIVTLTRPSRACCGDHCMVGGIRAAGLGFVVETPHQSRQDVGLPIGYHSRGQDLRRHRVVAYDRQYRREALARNYLNWSVVNSRLYSEALTGRAKVIPQCRYCLSETYDVRACLSNPDILDQVHRPASPHSHFAAKDTICRNFNDGRCRHDCCKYQHMCRECLGPHPWLSCLKNTWREDRNGRDRSRPPRP